MRTRVFLTIAGLAILATVTASGQAPAPPSTRSPIVIELFTSEGCSSCPPADRTLAQLQAQHSFDGSELIVLGEHVDYWNQLGWVDRFATHEITQRQSQYADALRSEPYTPELIVDGHVEIKDGRDLKKALASSAEQTKPAQVTLNWSSPSQLQVGVEQAGSKATVLFFVTEDNLTTEVKAGENGGVTLHHAAVVRETRVLGDVKKGSFHDALAVKLKPDWQRERLHFVVIVQEQHGAGPIEGAAAVLARE